MLLTRDRSLTLQAKLFRGLADHSRLSILQALRAGPRTVGEIVAATGLSQPNASNHLRCLSDCCLVASEQHGRFVRYRLSDARIARLLAMADEVSADAAQGLDDCPNYLGKPIRRTRSPEPRHIAAAYTKAAPLDVETVVVDNSSTRTSRAQSRIADSAG